MGDADASSLNKNAGLRFANNSNSFLKDNNACSGLTSQPKSSHLGPPTAPNKMASDFFACAKTSSGRGDPCLS